MEPCLLPFSEHRAPRPPLPSWIDPPHVCVPGPSARFHWSAPQMWYQPSYGNFHYGWHGFPVTSYRQDLVPLLQPAIQSCSSIFFNFGHINAGVIGNIVLVNTSNYVEPQTWKNKSDPIKLGGSEQCCMLESPVAQVCFQRQIPSPDNAIYDHSIKSISFSGSGLGGQKWMLLKTIWTTRLKHTGLNSHF